MFGLNWVKEIMDREGVIVIPSHNDILLKDFFAFEDTRDEHGRNRARRNHDRALESQRRQNRACFGATKVGNGKTS